jgi:glycosyltransferase involved in cell wall biosynthesis
MGESGRLRVLMATTSYPRWPGDLAGGFIADLAVHLVSEEGVEVAVLAPGAPGVPSAERVDGVRVRRLNYSWPRRWQHLAYGDGIPWNLRHRPLAWLNLPPFFARFAQALCTEGPRADLIHAHWGVTGAIALATQRVHRRPVVLTVHGSDLRSTLKPVYGATCYAIRGAAAVITESREFYEQCRALRNDPSTCYRLADGVRAPRREALRQAREARRSPGRLRLVTVGRLVPERRHDLLVRALAAVRTSMPAATLTIVGDGPARLPLEGLATQLGLADHVRFAGRVPRDEVPKHLLESDLYVSPTTIENFGFSVVEAAVHAVPVVTTRVGFPAELVLDGETGYVVPPADLEALTAAIRRVLADDGREAMGWRMRQRAEDLALTCSLCAERVMGVYRAVLERS